MASGNNGRHDFGYQCMLPKHIHVENLLIDDTNVHEDYKGTFIFNNYDTYDEDFAKGRPFPYGLTETVTLKNVFNKSGNPIHFFEDERLFPGVKITVED